MSKEEEYLKDLIYSLVTVHLDMGGNNKYGLSYNSHKLIDEIKAYLYDKEMRETYGVYNNKRFPYLDELILDTFNSFDNINFYINRVKPYSAVGRNQNEEEAIKKDIEIRQMLYDYNIPYIEIDGDKNAFSAIMEYL